MNAPSAPGQAIRLLLEITRAPDGRLEGRIRAGDTGGTGTWVSFSGVLELLRALEDQLGNVR